MAMATPFTASLPSSTILRQDANCPEVRVTWGYLFHKLEVSLYCAVDTIFSLSFQKCMYAKKSLLKLALVSLPI